MPTGREVVYRRFDDGDPAAAFELTESPVPERVGPREVLVRIRIAPVHPCDLACARGIINGVELPAVGGLEALGVVERAGEGLTERFAPGQRVHVSGTHIFGRWQRWQGVWRDYAVCPPEALVPVPDGVPDEVAAQLFVNVLTPLAMIREMGLGRGDVLLQTAAGSVLGQVMIQLGEAFDFTTINLVRRQATAKQLIDRYGIDTVFVFDGSEASAETVRREVRARLAGRPVRFAIEAVSGRTGRLCLDLLGPDGLVYFYGILSGDLTVPVDVVADLAMNNNTLRGWSIQEIWLRQTDDEVKRSIIDELWQLLIERRVVLPPAGSTFPLERFREAVIASTELGKAGKVMLACSPD
jgi:NADPH:quinone reductase-like Zn-dependent oxidoreductase